MTAVQSVHVTFELWGAVFCAIAAFCIYIARTSRANGYRYLIPVYLGNILLLCTDALAWIFRGDTSQAGWYVVRICNFLVYAMLYGMLLLSSNSLHYSVLLRSGQPDRAFLCAVHSLCALALALLVLSRFFGFYYVFDGENRYQRARLFWLHPAFCLAGLGLEAGFLLRHRRLYSRRECNVLLAAYVVLPAAGALLQMLHYGISYLNIALTVSLLLLFAAYEMIHSEYVRRQTEELAEARVRFFQRQLAPHFIVNSVRSVRDACTRGDTDTAVRLLDAFGAFMQGSLDALRQTECISLTAELQTVRSYLTIEQERSPETLAVRYEVEDTRFALPAFTLQILAENAVRHGIRKAPGGAGTVTVRSFRTAAEHIAEVNDDGAGFDPALLDAGGEGHVGLKNVRTRLALMCGGTLELVSAPGKGTTARVHIPLEQGEAGK